MTAHRYHSTHGCTWANPRPHTDAHQRMRDYGPVRPMDEPRRFLERAWRWLLATLAAIGVPMLIHHVASTFERVNL